MTRSVRLEVREPPEGVAAALLLEAPREALVGRGPEADVRLAHPTVGRRHLRLAFDGATLTATPAPSPGASDTFVNDERLEGPRALQDGDRLRVGALELVVRLQS